MPATNPAGRPTRIESQITGSQHHGQGDPDGEKHDEAGEQTQSDRSKPTAAAEVVDRLRGAGVGYLVPVGFEETGQPSADRGDRDLCDRGEQREDSTDE
ncbi:hypothetical protein ACFQL1_20625 [Halomicroarcula sp. GCM10025709]|uniref:hypothetical protein n=1 Tax=Haloarcula TaxID=2237 RepID=UPI0024C2EA65|nr:hypothetical protein [Halomicroarcula sp. YJ-61-S]